jgi:hypothetical protein
MEEQTVTPEIADEPITKERKKPNITPEDRARRAERMRELANKRNDLLKKQKAERFPQEDVAEDKPKAKRGRKPKAEAEPMPQPMPQAIPQPIPQPIKQEPEIVAEPKRAKKPAKKATAKVKKVRTLVIQSDSDSEDYGDDGSTTSESEEDEPVIYIAKKSRSSKSLTKQKPSQKVSVQPPQPIMPEVPQIRVKFF